MIRVITIVAAIITALTWIVGWWAVPLVAAVTGVLLWTRRGVTGQVALAGAVGSTMGVPAGALLIVTLLFAALLAWSAATIGAEIRRVSRRGAE